MLDEVLHQDERAAELVWLASRGYHDPVATPHVFAREEVGPAGRAQIYRCVLTGAERRWGFHGEQHAHS